jgi:hypothetical protein
VGDTGLLAGHRQPPTMRDSEGFLPRLGLAGALQQHCMERQQKAASSIRGVLLASCRPQHSPPLSLDSGRTRHGRHSKPETHFAMSVSRRTVFPPCVSPTGTCRRPTVRIMDPGGRPLPPPDKAARGESSIVPCTMIGARRANPSLGPPFHFLSLIFRPGEPHILSFCGRHAVREELPGSTISR